MQLMTTVNGSVVFTTATGYLPYTNHTFKVEACNRAGCVSSASSSGFTAIYGKYEHQKPNLTYRD